MKSITLKITKEKIGEKEMFFSSYELLKMAINTTPQQGFNVDEMQKRLRLLAELDKHKNDFHIEEKDFNDSLLERTAELELEDSDYAKLKELIKDSKWGVISQSIVELCNQFK